MLEFLVDNIFVVFAGKVFQQIVGIPMGTNCAPLLADIFQYSYEAEFIQSLLSAGMKRLASQFNFTYRYIDDVLSINDPDFENYLGQMYPPELEIKDTAESNTSASFLDLLLSIGRDVQLRTSLYDKRDDFNFHITNFPFLSSNIPSLPAYGVFISQLIRYARACSSYECFILRAMQLSNKLLGQGYVKERLKSSLRKFYGRYGDLTKQYEVPLSRMLHDILDDDHIQWHPTLIEHYTSFWPLLIWTLLPNLTFYLIVQGFHRTYATGVACQQRTLTPPDTWSCPTLGLACVLMSRPISSELVLSPDFWISNIPRYFSFPLNSLFEEMSKIIRWSRCSGDPTSVKCNVSVDSYKTCSFFKGRVYSLVRIWWRPNCKLTNARRPSKETLVISGLLYLLEPWFRWLLLVRSNRFKTFTDWHPGLVRFPMLSTWSLLPYGAVSSQPSYPVFFPFSIERGYTYVNGLIWVMIYLLENANFHGEDGIDLADWEWR